MSFLKKQYMNILLALFVIGLVMSLASAPV
jgi:hypothetical protein